jgi:hypothetical protein
MEAFQLKRDVLPEASNSSGPQKSDSDFFALDSRLHQMHGLAFYPPRHLELQVNSFA